MNDQTISFRLNVAAADALAELGKARTAMKDLGAVAASVGGGGFQQLAASFAGIKAPIDSARVSADAFKEALDLREAFDRLRASLDPAFAATQRFAQAQLMAAEAVRKGVVTEERAAAVLSTLAQRLGLAGTEAASLSREVATTGGRMGGAAFAVQNAAFQISDFAVQVGMGTSAMRAAGQQLPQLLGGFGAWGAVIGGAVAVTAALAPALLDMGDAEGEAKTRLDALNTALDSFNTNADLGSTKVEDLRARYGAWAEEIRQTAEWMTQVDAGRALDELQATTMTFSAGLDAVVRAQDNAAASAVAYSKAQADLEQGMGSPEGVKTFLDAFEMARDRADELAAKLGMTAKQARTLDQALQNVRGADSMQALHDEAAEALKVIRDMYPAGALLPDALAEAAAELQKVEAKAAQGLVTLGKMPNAVAPLMGLIADAVTAMEALVGAAPGANWLDGAIGKARALAAQLWDAAAAAVAAAASVPPLRGPAGMGDASTAYTGATPAQIAAGYNVYAQSRRSAAWTPVAGAGDGAGGGGGGGGGGGSAPQDDFTSISAEAKKAMDDMKMALAAIQEKANAGLIDTAEATQAIADAKKSAADNLAELIPQLSAVIETAGPKGAAAVEQWRAQLKALGDDLAKVGSEFKTEIADNFKDSFVDAMMGSKDAFSGFMAFLEKKMLEMAYNKYLAGSVSTVLDGVMGAVSGIFGFAKGDVVPFADGGVPGIGVHSNTVLNRPTFFGLPNGKLAVAGEAGEEAIMPLKSGGVRAVGPDGRASVLALTRALDGSLAVQLPQWTSPALGQLAAYAKGGVIGGSGELVGARSSNDPAPGGRTQIVNIQPPAGYEAKVDQSASGDTDFVHVIFDAIDQKMAENFSNGRGATVAAVANAFGLRRQGR